MLPLGSSQLHSLVVGDGTLAETLSEWGGDGDWQLAADPADPAEIEEGPITDGRADCIVVDGAHLAEESVDVVAECVDQSTSLPVVLLVDGTPEVAADALAAGATETVPRQVATENPEVFVEQLLGAIERERARNGFGELFENVSDGLVVHDPESGEIREVNDRYCELTGYDRDQLVGETLRKIIPTDPVDTYEDALERIDRAREEGPQLFEFEGQRADGRRFVGETHLSVVDIHGEEQVLASVRDVTERKRREREYEQIFNSVNDTIAVIDPDSGDIVDANESLCDLLGYEKSELVGMDPTEVSVTEEGYTKERGREIVDSVVESGQSHQTEWQVQTREGSTRWLDIRGTTATIGAETRYLSIGRDITERRRLERTYREVFENVSDGLVVQEPETGQLLDANDRYCELMGYDREELIGMTVVDLIPEDADYTETEAFERIERAREEGPQLFEVQARRKDGTSFVGEIHLSVVELRGEERILASVRDVTGRKRRERMVESLHGATERLQEAETTEAACRTTVEATRDVLGFPMTACWLHREDETGENQRLEPVAATDPVRELDPSAFRPGDLEYEAFRDRELLVYDPSEYFPENPLDAAIMLPLGEHGMLAAGKQGVESYDEFVVDAARTLAGHVRTALDRIARAEQLRENERRLGAILDRIDESIFLAPATELDDSDPAADYVSAGYEDVYGLALEEMHESYEEGFFGILHPDEYDAYWEFVRGIRADIEAGDPADRYSREYRVELPDGELRWVHSDYYPTEWAAECKIVVVSRDITDRKEREHTLESFHDATAELTTADTVTTVGEIAVRAAADVFALPATAVYTYDEERGVLDPAASGPGVEGDLSALDADDDPAWAAFVEERMRRIDTTSVPELAGGPTKEVLLVPLGGTGLLAVWHAGEQLDPDAASIMAATVEAALNRLRGERRLQSRSEELEAQLERARRLEAVTELTQRVEAAITAESSRRGVQEAVCEELTDVEPFGAAWVAEADVGTDRLTPRAVAGIERDRAETSLDAVDSDATADPHPAYEAWESGHPAVVEDLVGGRRSGWRRELLARGAGSVCAVPLAYGGVTHGVLTVVADEPDAFGEREREVFDQLGTSIGYAITAIERQRALESDDTLELEFTGSDVEAPVVRLARDMGCRVRHERTVRRQDGSVSVYYTLSGDLPEDVAAATEETLPGTVETVTREDGEAVIERRGSSWFGAIVSEYGGVLRHGEATPAQLSLIVELPRDADTRTIVDRIQETFPELELTAQRQHRETAPTSREISTQLERRLTDRQREALETAHAMGYFDWPRESSGEDVADALDITQPTVNKHIRLGERKVFELLFGSANGS